MKNKNPLVTIYITNYNYGPYLVQSIESVLSQTFKDYELIIIDDGSTDNSKNIIDTYKNKNNIFIIYQKNKGLNISNNIALKVSRGKYIMRLDADDYLDDHAIEIMTSKLEKVEEIALVFPDYFEVDKDGNIISQIRRHNFDNVKLFDQPAHGACTLIRTKILKEVGGYDESETRQDGYDLWLKIIDKYKVKNVSLPLFYYRQHEKSITKNQKELLAARSRIVEKHVLKLKKDLSVLSIIPTRGNKIDPHSVPLSKLGDKKLIDWTIEASINSDLVKDTIITSPDSNVLEYVKHYGDKIISLKRKKSFAELNQSLDKTIDYTLKEYENNNGPVDLIIILNIEFPFRSTMYINKAINTLKLFDTDCVIGAVNDDNIYYQHDGNGLKARLNNSSLRLERNNLFRKAGGISLIKRNFFKKQNNLTGGVIGHIILDEEASLSTRSYSENKLINFLIKNSN